MSGVNEEVDLLDERRSALRWVLVFLPLVVFVALVVLFGLRLFAGDASRLPSALIGKPVPAFALGPVAGLGRPGLAKTDLTNGQVTVLNVFASWCAPCREEHPALIQLAQSGIHLVGIAYKDRPENTRRFLDTEGDPFSAIGADVSGRTGIDFGVYGVPETYVVKGDGTIATKIVGPLTDDNIKRELLPALAAARGQSGAGKPAANKPAGPKPADTKPAG